MPRRAGTYDATVATTSRTSAVTANVHGSSGSTSNSNRSSSRVSAAGRDQPGGDADRDEAQRLAEHEAEHRRRPSRRAPCGRRFPASAPAPSTPSRRRHRPPRAPARPARTRRAAPKSRADARSCCRRPLRACGPRPALPVPSRERRRVTLVASSIGSCSVRTKNVMPLPGRCVRRDEDRLADRPVQRRPDVADDADDRPFHVVPAVGVVDVDREGAGRAGFHRGTAA